MPVGENFIWGTVFRGTARRGNVRGSLFIYLLIYLFTYLFTCLFIYLFNVGNKNIRLKVYRKNSFFIKRKC